MLPDDIRVVFIGAARSGKDTAAYMLCEQYGVARGLSTSEVITRCVAAVLGWDTQRAHDALMDLRPEWRAIGDRLRAQFGPSFLIDQAWRAGNVVTGLRDESELRVISPVRGVWIVGMVRDGCDDTTFDKSLIEKYADYVIDNNGDLDDLRGKISEFTEFLLRDRGW
jgi:hypothetical protein